jgi:hypothetical protein
MTKTVTAGRVPAAPNVNNNRSYHGLLYLADGLPFHLNNEMLSGPVVDWPSITRRAETQTPHFPSTIKRFD